MPDQYATAAQLASLGLPAHALAGITIATQNDHLQKASARVNSYLRGRYKLPLATPVPDEIVEAVVILAAYSLLILRGFNADEYDENFRQRYIDLIGNPNVAGSAGWLDKLARGHVNLAIEADATPGTQEGSPKITKSNLRGWTSQDSDLEDVDFIC